MNSLAALFTGAVRGWPSFRRTAEGLGCLANSNAQSSDGGGDFGEATALAQRHLLEALFFGQSADLLIQREAPEIAASSLAAAAHAPSGSGDVAERSRSASEVSRVLLQCLAISDVILEQCAALCEKILCSLRGAERGGFRERASLEGLSRALETFAIWKLQLETEPKLFSQAALSHRQQRWVCFVEATRPLCVSRRGGAKAFFSEWRRERNWVVNVGCVFSEQTLSALLAELLWFLHLKSSAPATEGSSKRTTSKALQALQSAAAKAMPFLFSTQHSPRCQLALAELWVFGPFLPKNFTPASVSPQRQNAKFDSLPVPSERRANGGVGGFETQRKYPPAVSAVGLACLWRTASGELRAQLLVSAPNIIFGESQLQQTSSESIDASGTSAADSIGAARTEPEVYVHCSILVRQWALRYRRVCKILSPRRGGCLLRSDRLNASAL